MHDMRNCPICENNQAKDIYYNQLAFFDKNCDMSYNICCCDSCGFVFANSLPNEDQYKNYYTNYSKYDKPVITPLMREMGDSACKMIKSHIPLDSKVLDIGCSLGYLLFTLKNAGYLKISGVDPAPNAQQIGKDFFNVNISHGFFDSNTELQDNGLFIFSAVLEHISNLRAFLKPLSNIKSGNVFIEVPAADYFSEYDYFEPFGEFSLEHINFFGRQSLTNLMSVIGFEKVEIRTQRYSNGLISLQGMFKKKNSQYSDTKKDVNSLESIYKYINHSRRSLIQVIRKISEIDDTHGILIYGAGSHTARILNSIIQIKDVIAILDNNKNLTKKKILNIPIYSPENIKEYPHIPIIISSFLHEDSINQSLSNQYLNPTFQLYHDVVK